MHSAGRSGNINTNTTDENWGQISPSRWGQRKSSFSAIEQARCEDEACRVIAMLETPDQATIPRFSG